RLVAAGRRGDRARRHRPSGTRRLQPADSGQRHAVLGRLRPRAAPEPATDMSARHMLHVVGTRPNFVNVAPVMTALGRHRVRQTLVHTGQHYDVSMSDAILRELGVRSPEVNPGVGSGSHAFQTGEVIRRMTECLVALKPDLMLVYGAANSTLGATPGAGARGQ